MDCSPPGSSAHGDGPGKNTRVGCHALLQEIFPIQESNGGLPHCRWILCQLSCQTHTTPHPHPPPSHPLFSHPPPPPPTHLPSRCIHFSPCTQLFGAFSVPGTHNHQKPPLVALSPIRQAGAEGCALRFLPLPLAPTPLLAPPTLPSLRVLRAATTPKGAVEAHSGSTQESWLWLMLESPEAGKLLRSGPHPETQLHSLGRAQGFHRAAQKTSGTKPLQATVLRNCFR